MSRTRPAFTVATLMLFLSLCCRTGSLLTVSPLNQAEFAPTTVTIDCHFNTSCTDPSWNGPALTHNKASTSKQPRRSILTIRNLAEEDEGEYHCRCNGRDSVVSNLVVNHHPNVDHVDRNQTFHRGETIFVACDSYPGDPVRSLIWLRNGNVITEGQSATRVRHDGNYLEIEGIQDDDSGVYTCGYNTVVTFISTDIMVNVIDPPDVAPNPMLDPDVYIRYNESEDLRISCDEHINDPSQSLEYSWIVRDEHIPGPMLCIPYDDVLPGLYRCRITKESTNSNYVHSVFVHVIQTPPVIDMMDWQASNTEYQPLTLEVTSRFSLENSNVSLQWQDMNGDENVSFASRVSYRVRDKKVTIVIAEAQLSDRGTYMLNVTNKYGSHGSRALRVTLYVDELSRTTVETRFRNLQCDQIQENREAIINHIADAYACGTCGDVRVEMDSVTITPSCEGEEDSTREDDTDISRDASGERSIRMILVSQDTLPPISLSHLMAALDSFSVDPSETCVEECSTNTPSSSQEGTDPSIVVSVVVAVSFILIILLMVFLFAILIWRCQNHSPPCDKYRVGQREDDHPHHMEGGGVADEPRVVVQPIPAADSEVQCTGYKSVTHACPTVNRNVDATATPVSTPFSGTHPSPLPPLANTDLSPPTNTSPPCTNTSPLLPLTNTVLDAAKNNKRPHKLFARSLSTPMA